MSTKIVGRATRRGEFTLCGGSQWLFHSHSPLPAPQLPCVVTNQNLSSKPSQLSMCGWALVPDLSPFSREQDTGVSAAFLP